MGEHLCLNRKNLRGRKWIGFYRNDGKKPTHWTEKDLFCVFLSCPWEFYSRAIIAFLLLTGCFQNGWRNNCFLLNSVGLPIRYNGPSQNAGSDYPWPLGVFESQTWICCLLDSVRIFPLWQHKALNPSPTEVYWNHSIDLMGLWIRH